MFHGNLTKDSNKGIADISWNSLNLPDVVTFADGSTVTYTYAADGTKLRTLHTIGGATSQTDYAGSVLYENGMPKSWMTEAGYISMDDSKYHYYLQDHQRNNRVVVSETDATEEVNHYYAFGGLFGNNSSVQPFKYNGKELDTKKGLNWYDYGARQYDASLGRFTSADPSAENYFDTGIYAYCGSNPINRIDPDGADWYQDDKGNYRWQRGSGNLEGYTNIGSTVSFQFGENSFLNFYQNGGIWANQAVNAFDLIHASPKLQNQFLGTGSVLSEEDQISLFRALMSRKKAELIQPIMQEGLSWAIGGLGSKAFGKVVDWGFRSYKYGNLFANKTATQPIKQILSPSDIFRIENAATRINKPINVVGSRASGKANAYSDWDYIIEGITNKEWKKIKNSLPGAKSIMDNTQRKIDLIKIPLDKNRPYITIYPRK